MLFAFICHILVVGVRAYELLTSHSFSDYPQVHDIGPNPKQGWVSLYLQNIPAIPINSEPLAHPDWTKDVTSCVNTSTWGITFDDGPGPSTPALLDFLDRAGIKVTFFAVGMRVRENVTQANTLLRAYRDGKIIQDVIGVFPKYFRPPYGDIDDRVRAVIESVGLRSVEWNRDSKDWLLSPAAQPNNFTPAQEVSSFQSWIANPTLDNGQVKGVVSLQHDLFPMSAHTAPQVLQMVMKAGYHIMPVAPCAGDTSGSWYTTFQDPAPKEAYVSMSVNPVATAVFTGMADGITGNATGSQASSPDAQDNTSTSQLWKEHASQGLPAYAINFLVVATFFVLCLMLGLQVDELYAWLFSVQMPQISDDLADDPLLSQPLVQAVRAAVLQALADTLNHLDAAKTVLILSGGLDTSIIADACSPFRFAHAITVDAYGAHSSSELNDLPHARKVAEANGINLSEIIIPPSEAMKRLMDPSDPASPLRFCIETLQTFDPMELRGGVALAEALRTARNAGFDTVVLGDAADELFAGYSFLAGMSDTQLKKWIRGLVGNCSFSANPLAAALGMRVVQPYLHPAVVEVALQCSKSDLIGPDPSVEGLIHGKYVLRCAFPEAVSRWRRKVPLETGSGTTPLGREFESLMSESEFKRKSASVYQKHGIVIRNIEHLHYFEVFERIFGKSANDDHANENGTPSDQDCKSDGGDGGDKFARESGVIWSTVAPRFGADPCILCGFELERKEQLFCRTCGAWPARDGKIPSKGGADDGGI
ncbi:hypothetical protein HDU84_004320 [Entophlyctis sp. JEL0112]|nr:hypothetical protein HDU84_004320 [Entophlyctis sp. JEL0112]